MGDRTFINASSTKAKDVRTTSTCRQKRRTFNMIDNTTLTTKNRETLCSHVPHPLVKTQQGCYNLVYTPSLRLNTLINNNDKENDFDELVESTMGLTGNTYKFYTQNFELRTATPRKNRKEHYRFLYNTLLNDSRPTDEICQRQQDSLLSAVLLPARLNNTTKRILLDTGSSISLIDKTLLPSNFFLDKSQLPLIRTANGTLLTVLGWTNIEFKLNDLRLKQKVLVSENLLHPIILGCNFLQDNKMTLNFNNATFTILNNNISHTFPMHITWQTFLCFLKVQKFQHHSSCKQPVFDRNGVQLKISEHLTITQHNQVASLLKQFQDIFTTEVKDLTEANIEPVKIELLPNAYPVNTAPYRLSAPETAYLNQHVEELCRAGILQESNSQFSSPVFLIKNNYDQNFRMVCDFRKINKLIKIPSQPLPTMAAVFSCLANQKFFTKIDLSKAYLQLPVHKDSRHILAIKTSDRLLEFSRLPFGLSSSPAFFQRAINSLLNKHLYTKCIAFLDDIILFGKTFSESLKNLKLILTILKQAGLRLNSIKCEFLSSRLQVLGHIVSPAGILPLEKNVEAIKNFPPPKSIKNVRQFLGMVGFYRKYIKDFAKIASPLTNLLKLENANKKFILPDDAFKAFETLKQCLSSSPLLVHFSDTLPIKIFTDASADGLGAMLTQKQIDGSEKPVAFLSRSLKNSERRYSSVELEFLAIIYALRTWKNFILGRHVDIYTDHRSLESIKNSPRLNNRLTKFQLIMSDYDVTIRYTPGKTHHVADALSRNSTGEELPLHYEDDILFNNNITLTDIKTKQHTDSFLSKIILAINDPEKVPIKFYRLSRQYVLEDDILYYKSYNKDHTTLKLVIPTSLHTDILKLYHDSIDCGHLGFKKTLARIQERFFWPNLFTIVKNYVKSCLSCQTRQAPTRKKYGLLSPLSWPSTPFNRISIDFLENLPSSYGFNHILTIIDHHSRFAVAYATTSLTAEVVVKYLLQTFFIFGIPKEVLSDRGSAFQSQLNEHLGKALQISYRFTTSYYPQCNGLVERFNQILLKLLSHFVDKFNTQWYPMLSPLVYSYNSARQTGHEYSPFEILYGHKPRQIPDLLLIPENIDFTLKQRLEHIQQIRKELPAIYESIQAKQKQYYDKHVKDTTFEPGELVLVQRPRTDKTVYWKFLPRFVGPYTIKKQLNPLNYQIEFIKNNKPVLETFHVSKLKRFIARD